MKLCAIQQPIPGVTQEKRAALCKPDKTILHIPAYSWWIRKSLDHIEANSFVKLIMGLVVPGLTTNDGSTSSSDCLAVRALISSLLHVCQNIIKSRDTILCFCTHVCLFCFVLLTAMLDSCLGPLCCHTTNEPHPGSLRSKITVFKQTRVSLFGQHQRLNELLRHPKCTTLSEETNPGLV